MFTQLVGSYRDLTLDKHGHVRTTRAIPNQITDGCYEVLAALLKRDPRGAGVLWFAVGTGEPAWDANPVRPTAADRALTNEVLRQPVEPEHIRFVDAAGEVTTTRTAAIEVRGAFAAERVGSEPLREFGLFGGPAGSETMINRVIHPPLTLAPGELLERRVQLSFGVVEVVGGLSGAFGASLAVTSLRGAEGLADAFLDVGVTTVDHLARFDPSGVVDRVDPALLKDVYAKARAVRGFQPLVDLELLSASAVWAVLESSPTEIMALASAPLSVEAASLLRDSLGVLRAALTDDTLRALSVRDVVLGVV